MKNIGALMLFAALNLGVCGCGGGGSTTLRSGGSTTVTSGGSTTGSSGSQPGVNPAPTIANISPSTSMSGGAPFLLTINGSNFIGGSRVNFGGLIVTAVSQSSTQLIVTVPAVAIALAGAVPVTVTNPAAGGGTSNAVSFTINGGPNPAPTITSLITSCAPVGAQSFGLDVIGSNFGGNSVVRWNGSDRPTTVLDAKNLLARIPPSDVATAATASITVFNPSPGGGSSNALAFTVSAGGIDPVSIAVDPNGKFAYVANEGCPDDFVGNVSMYRIDGTTGALTSIGSPVAADFGPTAVTVDPSGKFVYVANDGAFEVTGGSESMYTIDATTGNLTSIGTIAAPCGPPPSPGACAPFSIAMHPSGKFVYVANEGGFAPTSLSMYRIDRTTGLLSLIGVIATGGRAIAVTVDPSGKFAYAVDGFGENDNVSIYTIDAGTGALAFMGTIATGTSPTSIAVHPSGKFAYVTNSGSNDVSMYSINTSTGALTSIGTITGASGAIAIHPSGKFAYAGNSLYAIDAVTGALTFSGATAAAGSIMIHPSGKFAYVMNSGSNSVSIYSIDAGTGLLTLIGTVPT